MKKIIISVALLLGLSLTSCDEFLEVQPTDLLTEDVALQTYTDFSTALSGAYSGLVSGSYYGGNFMALADVTTDNLKYGQGATGTYQFLYNLNYTTNTGEFEGFFQQAYLAIYRANVILAKIDASTLTTAQKDQIRSECLMIRALAHHDLLRTFAQRYDATAGATHDGITIKTDPSLTPLPRNSTKEVYDQIIADITTALPILPTSGGPTRFTQRSANALRARVALYMRDWSTAETFATAAITGGPSLSTGSTYTDMWTSAEANGENIFKLKMPVGFSALGRNYWDISGNNDYFSPTEDLRTIYEPSDIRLNAFIGTYPGSSTRYYVKKYEGTTANPGLADIKVLRMSEMYLIRAEARARKAAPDEAGSLSDLNAVRTARGVSNGFETGPVLVDKIMEERRKEFFLEGHRWFDLTREKKNLVRIDCNAVASGCNMSNTDFRFTYPIPQAEIFANSSMTQNPGW
jgi:hypothetical protein